MHFVFRIASLKSRSENMCKCSYLRLVYFVYTVYMKAKKESVFQKIMNLIFSKNSPEAIKRKRLKEIARHISRTRYGKWYKPSSYEVKPPMADFFYSVYKVVGPGKGVLANAASSKVLKNITVETMLSEKQVNILNTISEENIKKRAESTALETLCMQVKKELDTFIGEFVSNQVQKIEIVYEHLEAFIHFVSFDYYFLLRKFDSQLYENNFSYTPSFQTIQAEYVLDDLKDFADVFYALPDEGFWKDVFEVFNKYKNVKPVNESQWKKLVHALSDLKRSKAVELIIRHISEDPLYKIQVKSPTEKITDEFISKLKKATETTLNKMQQEQKNSKAAVLVKNIFGDRLPSGMKNYSSHANEAFKRRGLDGFIYIEQMNYLKCFLIEYVKTDIRALSDLLLIRGKWDVQTLTNEYSESYHSIMQIAAKVIEFDERLADGTDVFVKFKTLMSRMEREKEARRQAQKLLDTVNESAAKIISLTVKHIIVIGNNFKSAVTDYDKPRSELIQNWKEIEQNSPRPIREWIVEAYKKIYNFTALMQILSQNN